jgi:cellulose synthase/poly-beta-1,6-N-acetylglucosamine synthase-like glycosyltransferase
MLDTFSVAAVVFWSSAAIIFYIYIGYPLLLALLAALSPNRPVQLGYSPSLTILIAAYNEAGNIARKLEQTLALDYPADQLEVLVLSDASTDGTDEIVNACPDSRVRLIRIPRRAGKTNAQNEGVLQARGEILVFSDATTVYHPQALRCLAANYVDPKVGAVSGRYQYFDLHNSATGLSTIAFWNYENLIKKFQSRIRTISGCCGCIYSVRRDLYTRLAPDIISDLVQPLWILKQGYRVVFEDRALAYEETTKTTSEEFSMRVRVITRGMRGLLSVSELLNPAKHAWIAFQLLSHKVLRWFAPVYLVLLFASSALMWRVPAYRFVFAAQALFYLLAILSVLVPMHRRVKLLGVPLYFCTVNTAALFSLIELWRGKKYAVWETVRS